MKKQIRPESIIMVLGDELDTDIGPIDLPDNHLLLNL